MARNVVFLSIPGLRGQDLRHMPHLTALAAGRATLVPSFPCVTWTVQANMLTGKLPAEHGVVANGFFWRDTCEVEMWTAWNERIEAPQIWDRLHAADPDLTSAVWFPMLSKGCGADYVCMPAPVHNPDGSESLWCYTKPTELYGDLRDELGHFPLHKFWGPMADIESSAWIADSAVAAARRFHPRFFFIYLPYLDYAAQRHGPDSPQADQALTELDELIGRLTATMSAAYAADSLCWMAATEYVIGEVNHVTFPNRVLRETGMLRVTEGKGGERIDFQKSDAWVLVDHQLGHVFVRDSDPAKIVQVADLFANQPGIAEVLAGSQRAKYALDHERSGDVVLISEDTSWQAYYWWFDNARAPDFARTVDIHQKPGYDPVELFFDPQTKGIPLTPECVRGSHGVPAVKPDQQGVLLTSSASLLKNDSLRDIDVAQLVLGQFGVGLE